MLNSKPGWYLLTALWVIVGLLAVVPALLSPMMFDAPGSTSNPCTIGLAISVAVFPLVCLAGAGLPWLLRRRPSSKWLFLLPLLGVAVIAAFVVAQNYFFNGRLA